MGVLINDLMVFNKNINESPEYYFYRKDWNAIPNKHNRPGFPLGIDIEITANCNLKCDFCRTTYNKYPNKMMNIEDYKYIIKQIEGKCKTIKLNWRGEPTLHPDLCEMVKFAKNKNILDIYFNTNAQLLTKDMIIKLNDYGLDRISISIDGYNKDYYEKVRKGGKWDKLNENLELLNKYGLNIRKRIQSVLIKSSDIDKIKEYKENYVNHWKNSCDEILLLERKEEGEYSANIFKNKTHFICEHLHQRLVITCEGNIIPCCGDHKEYMNLGNVRNTTIIGGWLKSKSIAQIHYDNNSHFILPCINCPFRKVALTKKGIVP